MLKKHSSLSLDGRSDGKMASNMAGFLLELAGAASSGVATADIVKILIFVNDGCPWEERRAATPKILKGSQSTVD